MRPTMGTLSGAEQISQSCRQSISSPKQDVASNVYTAHLQFSYRDVARYVSEVEPPTRCGVCPLLPSTLRPPARKFRHLFLLARNARSSELKRQSECRYSARCTNEVKHLHP